MNETIQYYTDTDSLYLNSYIWVQDQLKAHFKQVPRNYDTGSQTPTEEMFSWEACSALYPALSIMLPLAMYQYLRWWVIQCAMDAIDKC